MNRAILIACHECELLRHEVPAPTFLAPGYLTISTQLHTR